MSRAKLEYDDSGSTFFYFLVCFYLLVLLPVTYYLWPRKKSVKSSVKECQCKHCLRKRDLLDREKPSETRHNLIKVVILVLLWAFLTFLVFKVATAETEFEEYDPFEILQIDSSATMSEIKKQYRKLSKLYHPDKQGGDQEMFMKIAKAYEALTDEVSRENWEKYGNPDGPQAATFGIALPSWIVEKDNSIFVLLLYMGVFAVVLPIIVGIWWYRSIKYGTTNVLLQTSQLYGYFMFRSSSITPKRVIMILTSAGEFHPDKSTLLSPRPSDDVQLNEIIQSKELPHIDIKTKENPFCAPYAAKARILVHAHLERMDPLRLGSDSLATDQLAILKICPRLIQEMLSQLVQCWAYANYRQSRPPSSDMFECIMSVSQMLVQGMWIRGSSPILQLPHLTSAHLRHFRTKKRNITTLDQFVAMKNSERRLLVRGLSNEEYDDVMAVCAMFPHVELNTDLHVEDDFASKKITAGSLVTVSVTMTRMGLCEHHKIDIDTLLSTEESTLPMNGVENVIHKTSVNFAIPDPLSNPMRILDNLTVETLGSNSELLENVSSIPDEEKKEKTTKIWEKNKKRKKGKAAPPKKKQNMKKVKKVVPSTTSESPPSEDEREEEEEAPEEGDSEAGEESEPVEAEKDDEDEWAQLQKNIKKQKELDQRKTDSHPVHAPFFPAEKQECWWLYIVDSKRRNLICPPQRIVGLKNTYSTDLQFTAPQKPGVLHYTIVLNSDSYLDLSFKYDFKVVVHEHMEVSGTEVQWKDLEDDEEEQDLIEESESEQSLSDEEDDD